MHYKETDYGFEWGSAKIERNCSDSKKGWVVMNLKTQKHTEGMQIYVTKTGKIRIHAHGVEWKPVKKRSK